MLGTTPSEGAATLQQIRVLVNDTAPLPPFTQTNKQNKLRERTIPTDRPPLVDEI
jgi:hypothetical protein